METLLNKLEEDFEQSKIHGDGSLLLSKEHVEHYISLLKGGWVSVKERLPTIEEADETGKVLIYRKTNENQKGMSKAVYDWNMLKHADDETFWIPLPKNPTE